MHTLISELGLPPYDIFVARSNDTELPILIAGDRDVLGPLAACEPAIWLSVQESYHQADELPQSSTQREVIHV